MSYGQISKPKLIDLYVNKGFSQTRTAREAGIDRSDVKKMLIVWNIPIREDDAGGKCCDDENIIYRNSCKTVSS